MRAIQIARRLVRDEWGGVETAVIETAKRMPALGVETEVTCSAALAEPGPATIDGIQVTRHRHIYPFWGLKPEARAAMDKKGGNLFSLPLMRWLMRRPADVLHTHTLNRLGGIVRHVARRRRIPYVVSIHGGVHDMPREQAEQLRAPARGTLEWGKVLGWWLGSRHVLEDADAVICYGQRELELVRQQLPRTRIVRMPHGVDVELFSCGDGRRFREAAGLPASARVLLSLARIDPQKNQLLAVESLPKILSEAPDAWLVLMGPVTCPDYLDRLRQAARRHRVESRVRIMDGVLPTDPLLVDAYHAADLFLLPSMHEVFGIVVLEAWAAGAPVVASDVGGLSSLVRDGSDGLLFPSGDRDGLVRQCLRVLGDSDLSRDIQTAAGDRVRREFHWDAVTGQLVDLYEEVARELAPSC